jgi:hypothetical protein
MCIHKTIVNCRIYKLGNLCIACNHGAHIYFVYYIYLYLYFVYGQIILGHKICPFVFSRTLT